MFQWYCGHYLLKSRSKIPWLWGLNKKTEKERTPSKVWKTHLSTGHIHSMELPKNHAMMLKIMLNLLKGGRVGGVGGLVFKFALGNIFGGITIWGSQTIYIFLTRSGNSRFIPFQHSSPWEETAFLALCLATPPQGQRKQPFCLGTRPPLIPLHRTKLPGTPLRREQTHLFVSTSQRRLKIIYKWFGHNRFLQIVNDLAHTVV